MANTLETIQAQRIIAIVRLENYDWAVSVAQALLDGGISVIEFTLTGSGVHRAITDVRREFGDRMRIGVGTVLSPTEAEAAIEVGAEFVVTPVVQPAVIAACRQFAIPVMCGAMTPTEAWTAHNAGADLIKIFPARVGGPEFIRDLLAPLPQLRVVPTGGVSASNVRAYLEAGAVAIGAGGKLIAPQVVEQRDWAAITAQARAYREALS